LKRLVIHGEDGNTTRLLMRDPGKIVVMGTDQLAFACGPQKPARRVAVEYFQKPDAKLRSDGDVATIEYLGEPPPEGGPGPRQRLPRRN
jgi:hypothetical protein